MSFEVDLEDLGGDEIADDFIAAVANAIESGQATIMEYDLDQEVYLRVTVATITKAEFEVSPSALCEQPGAVLRVGPTIPMRQLNDE
jgi:hypothetical protein